MRQDGTTVMEHLEATAIIVAQLGLDSSTVAAALLHACLDDINMTKSLLEEYVPQEVVRLVVGVAKVSRISHLYHTQPGLADESMVEKLRAMLVALGDVRVMLIKQADRLHSVRNMGALPPAARNCLVVETEAVYVPIANRLGIWGIKAELEDLCFKAMQPQVHADLEAEVDSMLHAQKSTIEVFMEDTVKLLSRNGVVVEDIEGRPKSLSSIRSKQRPDQDGRPTKPLQHIHDVLAVRIIVASKNDCYHALRAIARRWPHLEARLKNYIKWPKANGYQSLHTVVLSDHGTPIEVQLRTPQMHWNAEYGVASHWRYKERAGAHTRGGGGQADEGALAAAHEQLVAWSRMVLAYGHNVQDHRKSHVSERLKRSSTLSAVAETVMATACGDGRPPRRPRRASLGSALPAASSSRTFRDFVSFSMPQPPTLDSIYVVVSGADEAGIEVLAAARGASTVAALLSSPLVPAGTVPAQLLVNGVPALSGAHPLAMGDVVSVVPQLAPALAAGKMGLLRPAAQCRMSLQRELFGLMMNVLHDSAEADAAMAQ